MDWVRDAAEQVTEWTQRHQLRRVALQLSDALLPQTAALFSACSAEARETAFFVLGDTSYGACCVDIVAARHVDADGIAHFGDTCMSVPSGVRVLFVLPRADASPSLAALVQLILGHPAHTVVLARSYAHLRDALCAACPAATIPALPVEYDGVALSPPFFGLEQPAFPLLYLTPHPESDPLAALLALQPGEVVVNGEPCSPSSAFVMKRRLLIERARSASAIAIVMGTASVAHHVVTARRCATIIRSQGKTAYTLSVGKITLEKLLNFTANNVSVFVLIGCPFATLQLTGAGSAVGRASSAVAALLTPHELHLAALPDRMWVPRFDWRLQYDDTVTQPIDNGSDDDDDDDDDEHDDVHHSASRLSRRCHA